MRFKIAFGERKQVESMQEDVKGFKCKFIIEGKNMENYIVINGKKAELTEEQLVKLGIKPEKNKYEEMLHRESSSLYYFIDAKGTINCFQDNFDTCDDGHYCAGNYCKDENIMKQRALHETLNRLLWRASVIAGELDNPWNGSKRHYYIFQAYCDNSYLTDYQTACRQIGKVYFPTEKSTKDAIENIVKPFMKEHPEFEW